jgi:hypothetical protein
MSEERKELYLNNIASISKHYSEKYGKTIYIFGEHHKPNRICKIPAEPQKSKLKYDQDYYNKYHNNIKTDIIKYLKQYEKTKEDWSEDALVDLILYDKNRNYPKDDENANKFSDVFEIIFQELVPKFPNAFLNEYDYATNVDEFIKDIIDNENKNTHIDFFLEMPYISKDKECFEYKSESYNVANLFNTYMDCFCPSKIKCKYKNVRFHHTDIRQSITENQIFLNKLLNFLITNKFNSIFKLLESDEAKEYKSLKTKENFLEYGLKVYSKFKLLKQQRNIPYEEVKLKILEQLSKCLNKVDFKIITHENIFAVITDLIIYKNDEPKLLDNLNKIGKIRDSVLFYTECYMDVYLVARMFRKFKTKENEYSEEPKNILIFAGEYHAIAYRKLLAELRFKLLLYRRSDNDCIKINRNELKKPLF